MDKYIGKLLDGRYEILDILGVGGMSVVYKARCRILNRFVAIKILKDEFAQNEELRKHFYNESQAVAKLSHNNIVSIYDVSHKEGLEYIVMELIDGITLKEYMQRKGRLTWQESLFFAQQIAKALAHAHSRGIIHQDIKPQNILLLRDGTVKVTDFGIARLDGSQETKIIREAIGSVHYMSPEQAKGGVVDYRTDIYSLGIVLYEMLTGRVPFDGDNAMAIVMQHISAIPLMPSEIVSDVPPSMDEIVMKAMNPVVSKRYFSAEEIYEDLQKIKSNPNYSFHYDTTSGRGLDQDMENTRFVSYDRQAAKKKRTEPIHRPEYENDEMDQAMEEEEIPVTKKKKRPAAKRKKNSTKNTVIAIVGFAVVAIILCFFLIFSGNSKNTAEVPDFVGKNIEDVLESSRYEDFDLLVADETVYDEDAEDGEIMAQTPDAGEKVKKGTSVTLTINKLDVTDEDYLIPDFAGKSSREVIIELLKSGVKYTQKSESSDKYDDGEVIGTSPEAGEILSAGDELILYVSSGKDSSTNNDEDEDDNIVSCPNLRGQTRSQAKNTLSAYGLKLGTVSEREDSGESGLVLEQSVTPGKGIEKGSYVNIVISIAPSDDDDDEDDNNSSSNNNNTSSSSNNGNGGFSVNNGSTSSGSGETVGVPITIPLPQDRDTCLVTVKLGDKTIYSKSHNKDEKQAVITVYGSGSQTVTVDVDGSQTQQVVTFN